LVISGDDACRMDLRSSASFHRSVGADATIMLKQCFEPMEYGLVLTDSTGRVTGFIEKPSADRIYTDLVNTGIYMLSPRVLERIPASSSCDFGSELFPALLEGGARIYGRSDPGYWNDVGSCGAYLRTSFDCLPDGGNFVSPGANVSEGSSVGPKTVIGSGSRIGKGSRISGSIVDGAFVGSGCRIEGSIICAGASVGSNCRLADGCVVGDGAVIGAGSLIGEGVRIWPGKTVEAGSVVLHSITGDAGGICPVFESDAVIRSDAVFGLTPELCMSMGASSGSDRRVAAASSGGDYAALCAYGYLLGAASAGKSTASLDSGSPATSAFAAKQYGFDISLFVKQDGDRLAMYFFDENGLPLPRSSQRKIEAACVCDRVSAAAADCRMPVYLDNVRETHAAAAAGVSAPLSGFRVSAAGDGVLGRALRLRGAQLVPSAPGVISLRLSRGGMSLEAVDEQCVKRSYASLLCALVYCELAEGGKTVCLPYSAPDTADVIAASLGGKVLRLGRDGAEAVEALSAAPFARDGVFLAMRLCSRLVQSGRTLSELMSLLPDFYITENVVTSSVRTPELMKRLGQHYGRSEHVSGMKIKTELGSARITADRKNLLHITAESRSMEAAGELCSEIISKIGDLSV
ncbi:MAG: hypothetical protein ILP09_00575, partial [Oscillospiraceae bacterium]|nr:hypothetical protein [Oscillospiraceae bacterium]